MCIYVYVYAYLNISTYCLSMRLMSCVILNLGPKESTIPNVIPKLISTNAPCNPQINLPKLFSLGTTLKNATY